MRRSALLFALAFAALALVPPAIAQAGAGLPHIRHVFIVVLENENADATFGADSPAPYLSERLRNRGVFVPDYYGTGHLSLGNYIAMISGQAPNVQTQTDCQYFTDLLPGTPVADGQVLGSGCVYPRGVETIGNQLQADGRTWKGYMEDMATSCRHPEIGAADDTQRAEIGDQYATRHNPFVYFHSIIDGPSCAARDVDYSQLHRDLRHSRTTPNYSFITPDLCSDGHDEPCVDGRPGGLVEANRWLRTKLPPIFASPAYRRHGLVIVTFDEAEAAGDDHDASACCNEPTGPNTATPGFIGPGGGRVGAVMISPCIGPGTTTRRDYNHYSLLRSIEDNFGLPHLGYAGQAGLRPFGPDVFSHPGCGERRYGR